MLGVILVLLALVALIPMFLLGGAIASAVIGQMLKWNGDATHEGSPLVDLNK